MAEVYRESRLVVLSTGNVYPFVDPAQGGASEDTSPDPCGEYAQSCLGRERMFEHFSHNAGGKVLLFRLNYAAELRYGVMVDVATQVFNNEPVDVTMGYANMVWQGYANGVALQSLALADSPPRKLNVTGPETVSIRALAERFGELMGRTPTITGQEAPNALLSDASECHELFGQPEVSVDTLAQWVAHWIVKGGASLGKPTHYETRDGKF